MKYLSLNKKIVLVFLFLAIILLIYIIIIAKPSKNANVITKKDYEEAIELLNAQLPIQLDGETQLRSVRLNGDSIEYTYALLKKQKFEIKAEKLKESFTKEILKTYCSRSDIMSAFRQSGYIAKYIYLDSVSQEVFTKEITPDACSTL